MESVILPIPKDVIFHLKNHKIGEFDETNVHSYEGQDANDRDSIEGYSREVDLNKSEYKMYMFMYKLFKIFWIKNLPKTFISCTTNGCDGDGCQLSPLDISFNEHYFIAWQYSIQHAPLDFFAGININLENLQEENDLADIQPYFYLRCTDSRHTKFGYTGYLSELNLPAMKNIIYDRSGVFQPDQVCMIRDGMQEIDITHHLDTIQSAIRTLKKFISSKEYME